MKEVFGWHTTLYSLYRYRLIGSDDVIHSLFNYNNNCFFVGLLLQWMVNCSNVESNLGDDFLGAQAMGLGSCQVPY